MIEGSGLVIRSEGPGVRLLMYRNDTGHNLYLDSSRERVVPEGSSEAAYLLVAAGCDMPEVEAQRYGLLGAPAAMSAAAGVIPSAPVPADTPKAKRAAADKAVRPKANKMKRGAATKAR